jgi:hypothetical protein
MLLFYDTIHTIVPDLANYTPSKKVYEILEKDADAVKQISPNEHDKKYDWDQYYALLDVLREIAEEGNIELDKEAKFDYQDGVPTLDIPGSTRVHHGKLADMLQLDLVDLGLARRTPDSDWLVMDKRIADLILSMLANNIKRTRNYIPNTVSDQQDSFAVDAKCDVPTDYKDRKAILASAILSSQVPESIGNLKIDQFIDIRKEYLDESESFHAAMNDLNELYFQRSFTDPEDFQKLLADIVTKYGRKVEKIKKSTSGKRIRKWGIITLGSIVGVSAAVIGVPELTIGSTVITAGLQVIQVSEQNALPGNNIARSQSLLVDVQKDLKWSTSRMGRIFSR